MTGVQTCALPISEGEYRDVPKIGNFRREYGIEEQEHLILFLSRLHPRKGGDILIDAVSNLSNESVRLVFVGPNEGAQSQWETRADDNGITDQVLFTGPRYGSDKLSAYVDADVFVLPSKNEYESFGNVVLEAMACGTPIVCTNVCGVSEWIEHTDCRVTKAEAEDLANGISDVLLENSEQGELREYVFENFNWENIAEITENVYLDVRK